MSGDAGARAPVQDERRDLIRASIRARAVAASTVWRVPACNSSIAARRSSRRPGVASRSASASAETQLSSGIECTTGLSVALRLSRRTTEIARPGRIGARLRNDAGRLSRRRPHPDRCRRRRRGAPTSGPRSPPGPCGARSVASPSLSRSPSSRMNSEPGLILCRIKPRSIIRRIRNVADARDGSSRIRERSLQPLAPAMISAGLPVIPVPAEPTVITRSRQTPGRRAPVPGQNSGSLPAAGPRGRRSGGREGAAGWSAAWTASATSCAVSASMAMLRRSITRRTTCPACRGASCESAAMSALLLEVVVHGRFLTPAAGWRPWPLALAAGGWQQGRGGLLRLRKIMVRMAP